MTDEQAIITAILEREGWPKFTNLPADRGGPTKGGITLASWREFTRNPQATAADLAAITEDQARAFYYDRHIERPGFAGIADASLRELVVDAGVHHGTVIVSQWLQQLVGVVVDGRVGPVTLRAVNRASPHALYLRLVARRVRLFGRLVTRDKSLARARHSGFELQAIFAEGWNNRAADFLESLASSLPDSASAAPLH